VGGSSKRLEKRTLTSGGALFLKGGKGGRSIGKGGKKENNITIGGATEGNYFLCGGGKGGKVLLIGLRGRASSVQRKEKRETGLLPVLQAREEPSYLRSRRDQRRLPEGLRIFAEKVDGKSFPSIVRGVGGGFPSGKGPAHNE